MTMAAAIALGDYVEDYTTLNFMFAIPRDDTGAPITLAGSPVVSVYKGSNTTQSTAGITLDVDKHVAFVKRTERSRDYIESRLCATADRN